eukprot:1250406-Rhodomonas_salina.1
MLAGRRRGEGRGWPYLPNNTWTPASPLCSDTSPICCAAALRGAAADPVSAAGPGLFDFPALVDEHRTMVVHLAPCWQCRRSRTEVVQSGKVGKVSGPGPRCQISETTPPTSRYCAATQLRTQLKAQTICPQHCHETEAAVCRVKWAQQSAWGCARRARLGKWSQVLGLLLCGPCESVHAGEEIMTDCKARPEYAERNSCTVGVSRSGNHNAVPRTALSWGYLALWFCCFAVVPV